MYFGMVSPSNFQANFVALADTTTKTSYESQFSLCNPDLALCTATLMWPIHKQYLINTTPNAQTYVMSLGY